MDEGWKNENAEGATMEEIDDKKVVVSYLSCIETLEWTEEAWKRMKEKENEFIYKNTVNVDYYTFERKEDIPGFKDYTMIITNNAKVPWYCNSTLMGILDVLMIGWIQRLFLFKNAKKHMLKLTKVILK